MEGLCSDRKDRGQESLKGTVWALVMLQQGLLEGGRDLSFRESVGCWCYRGKEMKSTVLVSCHGSSMLP